MWFLPKCDNVQIVNSSNNKYVERLESKKEWDECCKNQQKEIAKRLAFQHKMAMCGIYL